MTAGDQLPMREELPGKLLEINTWAMLLVIALILERSSTAVVAIFKSGRTIDPKVAAAVFTMALVFGFLLATTVGLLVLHVRFEAPYNNWYVVVDNVFLTVPLYVAVRFMAASTGLDDSVPAPLGGLDENLFRDGASLIAISFTYLFLRDLVVLPKVRSNVSIQTRVAVSTLHFVGAALFVTAAIVPSFIVYVAAVGALGLVGFFALIALLGVIEAYYRRGLRPPIVEGEVA